MKTLAVLAAAEANLGKLERLWGEIRSLMPDGLDFSDNPRYDEKVFAFEQILAALPAVAGSKPNINFFTSSQIAQMNLDSRELGEVDHFVWVAEQLEEPTRLLREYRLTFERRRADLLREALDEHLITVDNTLYALRLSDDGSSRAADSVTSPEWDNLKSQIAQVEALLGSTSRPARWADLRRHLSYGMVQDLRDILNNDWPVIRPALSRALYGENDPVHVEVVDLDELVAPVPSSAITTKLPWDQIDDDGFERLIFRLISNEDGYENPQWLMKTRATDRGRDLSVQRVSIDKLAGTTRRRVIIQAKHWLSKTVGLSDVTALREQVKLWEPPRIDVVVIATSGRFSGDAVDWIERHNRSDSALTIEMWPESHIELLLAARPAIVAEMFPNP